MEFEEEDRCREMPVQDDPFLRSTSIVEKRSEELSSSTMNTSDSTANNDSERPAVSQVKALLQRTLRVSISDGRLFVGTFACVDKQLNIVLTNTEEFRLGPPGSPPPVQGRYVTMVMIPWKFVTKVEAQELLTEDYGFGMDLYT